MASTVLNVLNEILSPRRPYCQLQPLVYLEVGFATGVPSVNLEIQMVKTLHEDPLVKNFVRLCTDNQLSYKRSPVETLDKLHGWVVFGEEIGGQRNGWAANETGTVSMTKLSQKPQEVAAGSVIMLSRVDDVHLFSSIFYITTRKQTIHEGELIGHVKKGLCQLKQLVQDFGTDNGKPSKAIFVHDCGQI